jgi:hypothetical protein
LMLNPSTADAIKDDPTIRKCIGFSQRWGYGGLEILNLFAYRSTNPKALLDLDDPFGPDNIEHAAQTVESCDRLVCAWGCESTIKSLQRKGFNVKQTLQAIEEHNFLLTINCLGRSPSGNPYHPLMLAYSTERQVFEV